MADTFTIGGTVLDLAATDTIPIRFRERLGSVPSLQLQRRGVQPPPDASDPWMGRSLTWAHDGTVHFSGVIRSRSPRRDDHCGWVIDYQAHGIRDLMDRFPLSDRTTGLDISWFNCHPEDLINYNAARAGRTVGQILTDVLTSVTNANNMAAYGLGGYTGLPTTPALPAATVADLTTMTVIPPRPTNVSGEKFGDALDGFLQKHAPNHRMWLKSDGTLRFLDLRSFPASTLTMGLDPIEPTELSRDIGDCFQRVLVRGAPIAVMFLFKLSDGSLVEDFAWGPNTNAAAKSAWTIADFKGTTKGQDSGTCTCPSTTTVTVTSSNAATTWAANSWDQTATGIKGSINLSFGAGAGITSHWTARVVSNTALAAGGTSTLTLDAPLPITSYDKYTLSGMKSDASLVWRKYKLVDSSLWPLVVAQSTYPQAFVNAGGGATMTSAPMGAVLWHQSGTSPPDNMFPLPFTYDGNGRVIFAAPTYTVAQNAAPSDVWVLLPINTGPNRVASPVDVGGVPQFAGTSHSVEGLADTLTVTMSDWRDPGQTSQIQAYADDLRDSVKDATIEGGVTYHGMYEGALTFGKALNVAGLRLDGTADTTGWEAAALPVVEVGLEWPQGADDYLTTMSASNRRAHYTAEMFLAPERQFQMIGFQGEGDYTAMGGAGAYEGALGSYTGAVAGAEQGNLAAGGDPLAQAYDTAAGQQPGEFAGVDPTGGLDFSGRGNNFASTGGNRIDAADTARQIQPETTAEAAAREERQMQPRED